MQQKPVSDRQLMILCFVATLSPFLRLIPGRLTQLAGATGWLCPTAAFPYLLLLAAALTRVLTRVCPNQDLASALLTLFGRRIGAAVLLLWSGWLTLHAGFLLRSGADRFIATIFPDSSVWMFVGVTALLALIGAMGQARVLARTAEIFCPLLAVVLVLILLASLPNANASFLLPQRGDTPASILRGALVVAEPVSLALLCGAFLRSADTPPEPRRQRRWLVALCVLATAVCAIAVGAFGAKTISLMSYPFFGLIWDINLFGTVQRVGAFVVGLWLLPDYVLVTMEIFIASDNLMRVFRQEKPPDRLFAWSGGGKLIWLCAVGAVVIAVVIAPGSHQLSQWSDRIIPAGVLLMTSGTVAGAWLAAKLQKRL